MSFRASEESPLADNQRVSSFLTTLTAVLKMKQLTSQQALNELQQILSAHQSKVGKVSLWQDFIQKKPELLKNHGAC